jgi:hypothetical protein
VKLENKREQHSEGKHQQGLVRLQKQQERELEQLKQEQQQRASAREQWEQEAEEAAEGGSAQAGGEQLFSPTAGGGASASANQGAQQQQQQGQPHNGGSAVGRGVKLEPVGQGAHEGTPGGVFVGTAVRRKFPGYGWYDGVVRRARSAGASVEFEVEWEDDSRAWIKQRDAQKYAARHAQGAGAGAGAGAGGGAGSGASGSF